MKFYPMCVNASLYPPKLIYLNVIAKSQGGSSENTLLSACCEILELYRVELCLIYSNKLKTPVNYLAKGPHIPYNPCKEALMNP